MISKIRSKTIPLSCASALIVAATACSVDVGGEKTPGESAEQLFPKTSQLWKQARHNSTTRIDTCWNMTQTAYDGTSTERGWVVAAIQNAWESAAAIDFEGWDRCSSGEQLKIAVKDGDGDGISEASDPAPAAGLGASSGTGTLNFTFNEWPSTGGPADEATRRTWIETIAVHELGHTLGFAHDQNRVDFPGCADGSFPFDDGIDGDILLLNPDGDSVMSYCLEGQSGPLSPGDIDMARRLYAGGTAAVKHDAIYALRNHLGTYLRVNGTTPELTSAMASGATANATRNLVRVERQNGPGSVNYEDIVGFKSTSTGLYVCTNASGTLTTSGSACYWTVKHTSGTNGGTAVNVNDSFELERGSVRLSLSSENDWRLLGPINTNTESFLPPRYQSGISLYPVIANTASRDRFCKDRGFNSATSTTTTTVTGTTAVASYSSGAWNIVSDSIPPITDFTVYTKIVCAP